MEAVVGAHTRLRERQAPGVPWMHFAALLSLVRQVPGAEWTLLGLLPGVWQRVQQMQLLQWLMLPLPLSG